MGGNVSHPSNNPDLPMSCRNIDNPYLPPKKIQNIFLNVSYPNFRTIVAAAPGFTSSKDIRVRSMDAVNERYT